MGLWWTAGISTPHGFAANKFGPWFLRTGKAAPGKIPLMAVWLNLVDGCGSMVSFSEVQAGTKGAVLLLFSTEKFKLSVKLVLETHFLNPGAQKSDIIVEFLKKVNPSVKNCRLNFLYNKLHYSSQLCN